MIRLEKHDEIVEAMARRIYANIPDASLVESERAARLALDDLLKVVVMLEVGKEGLVLNGVETDAPVYVQALILKLEKSHDDLKRL
jgi:hypothetical protein